jgi:putative transposase
MRGVKQPAKSRPSEPPHNPGVRELVANKLRYSSAPKREDAVRGFRGWNERGYLPHRDEPGLTQFVTFRLADTFPEALRSEWEHFCRIEDDRERRAELEAYLDRGRGACHLRKPQVTRIVEDGLRMFHGKRYDLRAWVVMPNHVHVLFKVGAVPMSVIVGAWKKHTGRLAHKLLGQSGAFWAEDYFDTFIRDVAHEGRVVRYIENNPTKARLVLDPKDWPWGSARFRNKFGQLELSPDRGSVTRSTPDIPGTP